MKERVCHRVYDLYSIHRDRSNCSERLDVDGYDDVVTDDDFDAIQVNVVRFGGWLDTSGRFASRKLCDAVGGFYVRYCIGY